MTLTLDRVNSGADSGNGANGGVTPALTPTELDQLVRSHLPLVGHLVRTVAGRVPVYVDRAELTSAAMYALASSARSFDPSIGTPFASFATIRIRGALTDALRGMDWASRSVRDRARALDSTREELTQMLGRTPNSREIAEAMGVSVGEVAAMLADADRAAVRSLQDISPEGGADTLAERTEGPEALVLRREEVGYLCEAVTLLPDRLRTVIEQYFFQQRKMADIAAELGVTESRVSQLRGEALTWLREGMLAATGETHGARGAQEATPAKPATGAGKRGAAARQAYRASLATSSTVAGRLAATTTLGDRRTH
jgi:RNA polymerase sigma factor for flagellar operon FliA